MNEKGFATIFGLCLILVIALIVKGIQESEMNHSYETNDFQVEMDLQNAADSGIYAAVEKVYQELILDKDYLPLVKVDTRINHQVKVFSTTQKTSSGDISVEVWAERILIEPYRIDYENKTNKKNIANPLKNDNNERIYWRGYTFFSKAEIDSERIGGKLYRRSFAYVVDRIITEKTIVVNNKKRKRLEFADADADLKKKIHFMDIVSEDYYYKN